jgi:hypothetical protein
MSDITCSFSCQRYLKGVWSHTLMVVMHTKILQNFCPPEFKFILCVHFIHLLLHHCHCLHRRRHHYHCHHHRPHLLTKMMMMITTMTITTAFIVVIFIGIIMTIVIVIISHSSRLPSRICFLAVWVILKCFNHSVFLMYIEYWCYFIRTLY